MLCAQNPKALLPMFLIGKWKDILANCDDCATEAPMVVGSSPDADTVATIARSNAALNMVWTRSD